MGRFFFAFYFVKGLTCSISVFFEGILCGPLSLFYFCSRYNFYSFVKKITRTERKKGSRFNQDSTCLLFYLKF